MPFNGVLALSLRFLLVWEDRKLDEKYGPVDLQKDVSEAGVENSGPTFRYILLSLFWG